MQELFFYIGQLLSSWKEKMALSAALAVCMRLLEQFCKTFDVDSFLVLLLLTLVLVDLFLGLLISIKRHTSNRHSIVRGVLKLPLFCLYLFLVGAIGISIEHSLGVGLPVLNIFVAYLIATEVFTIIYQLSVLGAKVPPLLLLMVHGFKIKIERFLQAKISDKLGLPDSQEEKQTTEDDGVK